MVSIHAQRHRPGNEYILELKPGWLTLATLGLYVRPWTRISYPDVPRAVGRFEADAFEPTAWKPEYPNPAFENMRPEDAFWAARIISRFDDATVRAVVEKARYNDPRATEYMTATLLRRRDKVLRAWLTPINPLVDFSLSASGELTFANAAEQAGVATPPRDIITPAVEFAKHARHNAIAHRNRDVALGVTDISLGSRNDVRAALKSIDDLIHFVEHHFLRSPPTHYELIDNIGGVDNLLEVLDRGLKDRDRQFGYYRSPHSPDPIGPEG